jgi:hypothetical protein
VSPVLDTIPAGTGSAIVSVGPIYNCLSDFAEGAHIFIRTDRGMLDPLGLTPSVFGGRYVVLDSTGQAEVTLDAAGVMAGGEAKVHAWHEAERSRGAASVFITDDYRRPVVWMQSPVGTVEGLVDSVVLTFSEVMDPDRLKQIVHFEICGATQPDPVIDAVSVSSDARSVTLSLVDSLQLGDDVWTLSVVGGVGGATSVLMSTPCGRSLQSHSVLGVTDPANNRLKDALATTKDYTLEFGDVVNDSEDLACTGAPISVFRPDGDGSSLLGQTDSLTVSGAVPGSSPPYAYLASVYDASGRLLRRERVLGASTHFSFVWDGRDQDERVVAPGLYELVLNALDESGNVGLACEHSVRLNNVLGVSE